MSVAYYCDVLGRALLDDSMISHYYYESASNIIMVGYYFVETTFTLTLQCYQKQLYAISNNAAL